jgi:nucleoside-diphosphate-sugar epimerase
MKVSSALLLLWTSSSATLALALANAAESESCAAEAVACCVTGGSGYLGLEVVAQLLERGHRVTTTVRSLANDAKVEPLRVLARAHPTIASGGNCGGAGGGGGELPADGGSGSSSRLTIVEADLLEPGSFDECVRGASVVFHTASPFRTSGVVDPAVELVQPAVEGTENVLRAVMKKAAEGAAEGAAAVVGNARPATRVVLTSSIAAIMGSPKDKAGCFDEDDWNLSSSLGGTDQLDWCKVTPTIPNP